MVDIAKQIVFWRDSAKEDWAVARQLVDNGHMSTETKYVDILAEMNAFHIEGRYPESLTMPPTKEDALIYITKAEKVYQWLMNQL